MHYVILRDDDTNALTPPECLEQLYRPFLERGLPVNLAVIPNVRTDSTTLDGRPEGFLFTNGAEIPTTLPIGSNKPLIRYLQDNRGFHIAQHGYHHDPAEFDRTDRQDIIQRLKLGAKLLQDAGFPAPETFVAPHDRLSPTAYEEVARRYRVLSTGWFELRRLPMMWWPRYVLKKLSRQPHWQVGQTQLLGHPGCLLARNRPFESMFETVRKTIENQRLTVLVTHWWEYYRDQRLDDRFAKELWRLADYLAESNQTRMISFKDLNKI